MKRLLLIFAAMLAPGFGKGLTFENTFKQIDAAPDARVIEVDFEFENAGQAPVTIARSSSSCSCLSVQVAEGKMRYQPGEAGVVRGAFDLGNYSGTVDKTMEIWLEGDSDLAPSVRLKVRINIPELVKVDPKTLRWDLGGAAEPKTFVLSMHHAKPIQVESVNCSNSNFAHELKVIEKGRRYELVVTPKSIDKQSLAVFTIRTDCEVARQRMQRAFAIVRRPVAGGE